jgi:hypothetical protein
MDSDNEHNTVDLLDALKLSLKRKGSLGKLQARLRYEVFDCIQKSLQCIEEEEGPIKTNCETLHHPKPPKENEIINSMIIEYLHFNGYEHSLRMFQVETGKDGLGTMEMSTRRNSRKQEQVKIPSLYSMVKNKINQRQK